MENGASTVVRIRKSSSSPDLTPSLLASIIPGKQGSVKTELTEGADNNSGPSSPVVINATSSPSIKNSKDQDFKEQAPDSPSRHASTETSPEGKVERVRSPRPSLRRSVSSCADREESRKDIPTVLLSPKRKLSRKISVPDRPSVLGPHVTIGATKDDRSHGGISPSFMFLQLFHTHLLDMGPGRPLALPRDNKVNHN